MSFSLLPVPDHLSENSAFSVAQFRLRMTLQRDDEADVARQEIPRLRANKIDLYASRDYAATTSPL